MGYIQGGGRSQGALFSVMLDDFIPTEHVCRVIDAFVEKLPRSAAPPVFHRTLTFAPPGRLNAVRFLRTEFEGKRAWI
jgi:transposase